MSEEKVEINDLLDVGRSVQAWQAILAPEESITLRFVDGGTWKGTLTLTAVDNLSTEVEGFMFEGDRTIPLSFVIEPDGPVDLPIHSNGRTWTSAEESDPSNDTTKAAFYASGTSFTTATAPKVAPKALSVSGKVGQKMAETACKAEKEWLESQKSVRMGLKWVTAKELLAQEASSDVWPAKMPMPVLGSSSGKKGYIQKRLSKAVLEGIRQLRDQRA